MNKNVKCHGTVRERERERESNNLGDVGNQDFPYILLRNNPNRRGEHCIYAFHGNDPKIVGEIFFLALRTNSELEISYAPVISRLTEEYPNNKIKDDEKIKWARVGAACGSPCYERIAQENKKISYMAMSMKNGRPKGAPTEAKIKNDNNISDEQCSLLQNTRNHANRINNNHNFITNTCRDNFTFHTRRKWNIKKCRNSSK